MNHSLAPTIALLIACGLCRGGEVGPAGPPARVLGVDSFRHYVDHFNVMEDENVVNLIPNARSWQWMRLNVPAFETHKGDITDFAPFLVNGTGQDLPNY